MLVLGGDINEEQIFAYLCKHAPLCSYEGSAAEISYRNLNDNRVYYAYFVRVFDAWIGVCTYPERKLEAAL